MEQIRDIFVCEIMVQQFSEESDQPVQPSRIRIRQASEDGTTFSSEERQQQMRMEMAPSSDGQPQMRVFRLPITEGMFCQASELGMIPSPSDNQDSREMITSLLKEIVDQATSEPNMNPLPNGNQNTMVAQDNNMLAEYSEPSKQGIQCCGPDSSWQRHLREERDNTCSEGAEYEPGNAGQETPPKARYRPQFNLLGSYDPWSSLKMPKALEEKRSPIGGVRRSKRIASRLSSETSSESTPSSESSRGQLAKETKSTPKKRKRTLEKSQNSSEGQLAKETKSTPKKRKRTLEESQNSESSKGQTAKETKSTPKKRKRTSELRAQEALRRSPRLAAKKPKLYSE